MTSTTSNGSTISNSAINVTSLSGVAIGGPAPATGGAWNITSDAAKTVKLNPGGLTSVSAGGNTVLFGFTQNGTWFYNANPSDASNAALVSVTAPPAKLINLNGIDISVAPGAMINASAAVTLCRRLRAGNWRFGEYLHGREQIPDPAECLRRDPGLLRHHSLRSLHQHRGSIARQAGLSQWHSWSSGRHLYLAARPICRIARRVPRDGQHFARRQDSWRHARTVRFRSSKPMAPTWFPAISPRRPPVRPTSTGRCFR